MAVTLDAPFRVPTINVRGLSGRRRQYQLSRLFAENELDIIAVQETKVESQEQTDRMVQPYLTLFNVCVSHAMGTSGGCCLFIRKALGAVETAVFSCAYDRFVICDFYFSNVDWRVIFVYAPTSESERKVFFEGLSEYIECQRVIICLGDFNCVCAPEDRANESCIRDQSAFYLNVIVASNALEDAAHVSSKGNVHFTHFQGMCYARLDRAYISLDLVPLCDHYSVKPVSFSDHALVMFTLGKKVKQPSWNWSLWKMNSSLLKDKVFTSRVGKLFEKFREKDSIMWGTRWELFKEQVKLTAIERSSILKFQKQQKEKRLRSELNVLLSEESAKPGEFAHEIRLVKNELEVLDCEKYRGAIVRARSERLWQGERPTKICAAKGYQRNQLR